MEEHKVRVIGEGEKGIVVLSHGFGGDQSCWNYIIPQLVSENYKVVVYNLKYHNTMEAFDSQELTRYANISAFTDDLLALLDELRIGRCYYVGHSVSGMIGCIAATRRPQIFIKLILIGASPRYLNDGDYTGGFEHDDVDGLLASIKTNIDGWIEAFVPAAMGSSASEEAIAEYLRTFRNLHPDAVHLIARGIFQSDVRDSLSSVPVPCHIIQTMKDFAVPEAVAQYLAKNLRGISEYSPATLHILNTDGHLPHLSSPNLLIPLLRKILFEESI